MPDLSSKSSGGSSPSGNSFADLAESIIKAIESGFQGAATQSQSGSAAASTPGATAGPASSIAPVSAGAPTPGDPAAGHGGAPASSSAGEHGSGEEGKPEHEDGEHESKGGGEHEGKRGRVKSLGEYVDRVKEGFWEEEVGVGYPALELATGVAKRINELDKGQYVSPEEKQRSMAEAVLPGAGGIIGAAVGTAFGNPVLGSFVGQGIGEVSASLIGAKSERDETTREAAEKLAAALGQAEESVHSFRQQIEATGAPVAQVSQGLGLLENTGIVGGAKAVAGQGSLALGLGEQFGPVETTLTQTISQNPALFRVADEFAQSGTLGTENFRGLAQYELLQGNLPAYTAAQQAASATRYTANPQIHKLQEMNASIESNVFMKIGNWAGGVFSGHNIENEDTDEIDKLKEEDDKKREEANKAKASEDADDRQMLIERGQARFDTIKTDSDANNLIMRYRYDANGNASPMDLAKRLPAIRAALEKNAAADQVMIDEDKKQLDSAPANSPLRPAYELEISQLQDDQIQKRNIRFRELEHSNYLDQVKTSGATSSLAETRATIEGKSAADIQRQVDRQSDYLIGMVRAPNNPLSPEEAAGIEEGALKQRYAAKIGVYNERLDENSLAGDQANLGVTRARTQGGGSEQVFQAQQSVLSSYTDRIKELSAEIERGGLTVSDRIAKEKELTSAQSAALTLSVEAVRERDASSVSILSSNAERDEAGLSRTIERGGNAGAGAAARADAVARIAGIDKQYADEKDPVRKAALDAQRSKAREDAEGLLDQTNTYRPAGAVARKIADDRASFQIAMDSPYLDGSAEADPLTRGNAVLGDLKQDLAGLDKNRARLKAAGTWRDEDETRYTDQKNSDRIQIAGVEAQQRTAFESMLPEMIAGSPGQGNMSGVLPTPGQAAYYNPNAYITGTFGQPSRSTAASGDYHAPQTGDAAGAFLSAKGSTADIAALTGAINRLHDAITRGSIGGRSPASSGNPAGFTQNVSQMVPGNGFLAAGR